MFPQSREPLRVTINIYGARAHQSGYGPAGDANRGYGLQRIHRAHEEPPGVVVKHVENGVPLTPLGRELLRRAAD